LPKLAVEKYLEMLNSFLVLCQGLVVRLANGDWCTFLSGENWSDLVEEAVDECRRIAKRDVLFSCCRLAIDEELECRDDRAR